MLRITSESASEILKQLKRAMPDDPRQSQEPWIPESSMDKYFEESQNFSQQQTGMADDSAAEIFAYKLSTGEWIDIYNTKELYEPVMTNDDSNWEDLRLSLSDGKSIKGAYIIHMYNLNKIVHNMKLQGIKTNAEQLLKETIKNKNSHPEVAQMMRWTPLSAQRDGFTIQTWKNLKRGEYALAYVVLIFE